MSRSWLVALFGRHITADRLTAALRRLVGKGVAAQRASPRRPPLPTPRRLGMIFIVLF